MAGTVWKLGQQEISAGQPGPEPSADGAGICRYLLSSQDGSRCGICLGRLSPMGKVKIGEVVVEALSQSGYIDSRAEVEVDVYKRQAMS